MATLASVIGRGLLAARPAAGTAGALYYATDGPNLYRDNGTTWDTLTLGGMTNPMTTANDLVIGGASGAPARLAKGSDGQVLTVDPTTHNLLWATPAAVTNGNPAALTGATAATRYAGGTAVAAPTAGTFAVGDFVIAQAGGVYVCTVAGTPGTWVQAGGAVYPTRATVWWDEVAVITGTTLTLLQTASALYNEMVYQTGANGDVLEGKFHLAAGTYTLSVLGHPDNNRGKVDWSIDGTTVVSGQDWYAAGATWNTIKTASVTVATSGAHTIRSTINGKNASSSGYYLGLTKLWLR